VVEKWAKGQIERGPSKELEKNKKDAPRSPLQGNGPGTGTDSRGGRDGKRQAASGGPFLLLSRRHREHTMDE
jgi:hypothetical protein